MTRSPLNIVARVEHHSYPSSDQRAQARLRSSPGWTTMNCWACQIRRELKSQPRALLLRECGSMRTSQILRPPTELKAVTPDIVRVATIDERLDHTILARCIHRTMVRYRVDVCLRKHLEHAIQVIPIDSCPIEIDFGAPAHERIFLVTYPNFSYSRRSAMVWVRSVCAMA